MAVQTSYATAPASAFAGMLGDGSNHDIDAMINAESSASIPLGVPVAYKTSSPASDKDVLMTSGSTDKYAGITIQAHDVARSFQLPDGTTVGELDGTGYRPGAVMPVLIRGTVWVKVKTAVAPGDRLWVAYDGAGTVYANAGEMGNITGTHANDLTNIGRFESSAAAGGFAKLRVDFSQKP